jgi:serine protease
MMAAHQQPSEDPAMASQPPVRSARYRSTLRPALIWAFVILVSACGGGGSGGKDPDPAPGGNPEPPATQSYSITGTVTAVDTSLVDSDTNDPFQENRASNNGVTTAQPASNPAAVVGYVNEAGEGPQGATYAAGDLYDLYRVTLTAGQVVELNFGDTQKADLDLAIGDSDGTLVGESNGLSRSECVRISESGTYVIQAQAFSGASAYELSWGPPRPDSSCPNETSASSGRGTRGFVAGELIAKPRAQAASSESALSAALSAGAVQVKKSLPGQKMLLLNVPNADTAAERAAVAASSGGIAGSGATKRTRADHAGPEGISDAARHAYRTTAAAKRLRLSGAFEYVELNRIVSLQQVAYPTWPTDDELRSRQPQLNRIELPAAFNALASLSPLPTYTPIVAVVDTGIVGDHPDLQNMLVPGFDFVDDLTRAGDGDGPDNDPDDATSPTGTTGFHGSHVAGTIAAETGNGLGVIGIAPMARIMPLRVLGVNGTGSDFDISQGILFAAGLDNASGTLPARRADVINMSLGGAGACPSSYADAITQARAAGTMVVAATGNESAPVSAPANCPGAIAVSAVAYDGALAYYSNTGPEVVVTAPGGDPNKSTPAGPDIIFSTVATFSGSTRVPAYMGKAGTSMATPHVSGVLALMRAVNPAITPAQVDALFASGALTTDLGAAGRDDSFGFGLIDAAKAVSAAVEGGGGTVPDPPTLRVTPALLDFGTTMTEIDILVQRINDSTDAPASFVPDSLNPDAIVVTALTQTSADAFPYRVSLDRSLLAPGENVIRVVINSEQGQQLTFDVSAAARSSGPVGNRGVGTVYVVAFDPDADKSAGQAKSTSSTPAYAYRIEGVSAPRVVVLASPDLDNDSIICGASEPCGAYPVLSVDMTVLKMDGNKAGIDFPLGTSISATSLGLSRGLRALAPNGVRRDGR